VHLLKSAGWKAEFVVAPIARVAPGITLLQRRPGVAIPHVQAVYDALRAARLDFTPASNDQVADGAAEIVIGPRP
jgi:hypothetical protein